METEEEIWADITGQDDYEVSNFGNIRRISTGRILSPKIENGNYNIVCVCPDGKRRSFLIHRLVAIEFLENPEKKELVIHKDNDKSNNNVNNLEWKTRSELKTKEVILYSSENDRIQVFKSAEEASEILDIPKKIINDCCKGKLTDHEGMKFRYRYRIPASHL